MPTDTAEMKDTTQTGTATATPGPEHHQTQAAAGSPQGGGAPTSNATGSRATSGSTPSGTSTSGTAGPSVSSGRTASAGSPMGMSRRGGSILSPFSMLGDPFGMMRSMMDQMNRLLGDFTGSGLGRSQAPGLAAPPSSAALAPGMSQGFWYPQVEVAERGGNLVVCADLPGMRKEDVHLEIHNDFLVLRGERHQEQEQNEGGIYRSERSYGQFYRTVPLPDGVDPDQARANFKDGVLEVTIPLPQQEPRQGRRIEIQ
ncbi:MAG: Hsp20/alpha crystallin family protein [Thermoanaerobaculia bacterium]